MPNSAPDHARPKGQARSSQNARTHGLTARDVIIAPDERDEFDELLNSYQTEVKPQGAIQQTIFDELVAAAWNLRRLRRMEAALYPETTPSDHDLLHDEELQKKLDRLARHKCCIERTFHRSLKELKALQTNSIIEKTLPPSVRQHVPPLSFAADIAKRTQYFERKNALRLLQARLEAPLPASAPQAGEALSASAS